VVLRARAIDLQTRIPDASAASEKSVRGVAEVMHAKCLRFMNDEQTARLFWSRLHCFAGKRHSHECAAAASHCFGRRTPR